jgi:hypothetical protein
MIITMRKALVEDSLEDKRSGRVKNYVHETIAVQFNMRKRAIGLRSLASRLLRPFPIVSVGGYSQLRQPFDVSYL